MKERLIKAEALKNYCRNKLAISVTRSGTLRKFAEQLTEDTCRDVDAQPTVEAIPVKWIKEQAEEYPGMESTMWAKLLRLWEKEEIEQELYGGER